MTEPSGLADVLASRLRALWDTEVEVVDARPLPGGASRDCWDVRVRTAGDAHFTVTERRLILLRNADGQARYPDKNVAVEAAAMIAARKAGVPVAEIYDYGQGALGQAYLLMERLEGETIPRRLLRDEAYAAVRPGLARRLGEILARIHQVDPDSVPGLPRVDALGQLTGLYQAFGEPPQALEIGLRWLAEHQPAPAAEALVHGDFRTGNLMVGQDGLHGVLDWELAHRGDPRQDLGWLCTKAWRYGSASPVGGFGARADLMAGYAAAGGTSPDEETQRWWELYGTVRWALLCRRQAERYLADGERSIELAVLGRRVCEQEYDLLLALGHASPLTVPDPLEGLEDHAAAPHDRPSGPELLRAVREFLITEAGLGAGPDPRLRFHALVAANALRIAQREAMLATVHEQDHRARLAALGCADDAGLCAAIRDGSLDHRFGEVVEAVRATTVDKLTVANPGHLAIPGLAEGDDVDFTIPEDLRHYLAELDEFIEREIRPLEEQDDNIRFFDYRREDARTDWDRGGLPSREWEALLAEARRRADAAGHYRYAFPRSYGGRDGTNLGMAVIREHLAGRGLGLHCDLQNEHAIVGNNVGLLLMLHYGSPEQKEEWIDDLAAGRRHFAFGITEPGHGSDATFMETRATRDGHHWVVNGEKTWNTGIHTASHDLVFARTSGTPGSGEGITGFLVPVGTPGFKVEEYLWTFNMPTDHARVSFHDVRVPDSAVFGREGRGLEVVQHFFNENRIRQAASSLGAAQFCIDRSVAYARTRAPFGKPLASNQAIQFPLVELHTQCEMLRALIYKTAWSMDQFGPLTQSDKVSMCNYVANRLCCEAADRAMQVHGGLGYSRHQPFEHIYRHHRRYRITEGAEEIQMRRVAGYLFGFIKPDTLKGVTG